MSYLQAVVKLPPFNPTLLSLLGKLTQVQRDFVSVTSPSEDFQTLSSDAEENVGKMSRIVFPSASR